MSESHPVSVFRQNRGLNLMVCMEERSTVSGPWRWK